jgi:DNA-3-methyladenine glycosylase II
VKPKKNTKPLYWNKAVNYLNQSDPIISKIINKFGADRYLVCQKTPFETFFSIITGQQISIEAANSIEQRVKKEAKRITAKNILNLSNNNLRTLGLSYRKINYIKGIAKLILINPKFFTTLCTMNDADAITSLSKLYGIGPWSAEMFLIFQYNRQNILPTGDVGLINSFCSNYSIDKKEFLKTIAEYKKIWNPYCTVATWYLWRDIDEDIVQY